MTSFINIIFILSCNLLICYLPTSHGKNQGYHLSTIGQELTPHERFMYENYNTLPDRIYYSREKGCYVVKGKPGYYKNDLSRNKGEQNKYIPRWQYYMNKLSPIELVKSGFHIGSTMLFGGDDSDDDDDVDVKNDDAENDNLDGDMNVDTDSGATNNDKNIEKEPESLSKDGEKKKDNNDKKDKQKDSTDVGDPENSKSYTGMVDNVLKSDTVEKAKNILQSDAAKETAKSLVSMFVPGGPTIIALADAASKYQSADGAVDKVGDKLPI